MKNKIYEQLKHFYPNTQISDINEIRYKDGIFVGTVRIDGKGVVVKYFENKEQAVEIANYKLLQKIKVPTPIIYHTSNDLIVMENINYNDNYHLANDMDLQNEDVIKCLANWYKSLHALGKSIDKTNFYSELDFIKKENLQKLKAILPDCESLELIIDNYENVSNKLQNLSLTITYNDFAVENMIVGKDIAMMYDHNKMGKGLSYFDIQNVCCMLNESMRDVFIKQYGKIPAIEKVVYDVLNPFITLIIASQRPIFPNWALHSKDEVYSQEFKNLLLDFIR